MEDTIISEVRRVRKELEIENKENMNEIFNSQKKLKQSFINRIVTKKDLEKRKELVS